MKTKTIKPKYAFKLFDKNATKKGKYISINRKHTWMIESYAIEAAQAYIDRGYASELEVHAILLEPVYKIEVTKRK
jgi:hypothetical protein